MTFKVPQPLIDAILEDRCVAFVGAGFSAGVVPTWGDLLRRVAERSKLEDEVLQIIGRKDGDRANTAIDYEMAGEILRKDLRGRFDPLVARLTQTAPRRRTRKAQHEEADRRRAALLGTPFNAILTTNFDPVLESEHATRRWGDVLRIVRSSWWDAYVDLEEGAQLNAKIIKLHGDTAPSTGKPRVVLARSDYRQLINGDPRYLDFLRTVFSTRKVLFIGTSFTDAYLNELRAAVLHLLRLKKGDLMGWAIAPRTTPARAKFFKETERIELLQYRSPKGDRLHEGVGKWLQAIQDATGPRARLARAVKNKRIVWVDEKPKNNTYGVQVLDDAGARLESPFLERPEQLDRRSHARADVIISHWGHETGAGLRVLDEVRRWDGPRPPVIVFASGGYGNQNRRKALRHGAFEYCWHWGDLLETLQRLFAKKGERK